MSKKSIIAIIFVVLIIIGCVRSCIKGDDEELTTTTATKISTTYEKTTTERFITIESIEFNNAKPLDLSLDDSEYDFIRVVSEDDFQLDDVIFISSDENVVTITSERKRLGLVYFTIEAVGVGSATIHAESVDGKIKSELINVNVLKEETETESTQKAIVAATEKQNIEYALNTSSKRIHYKSCSSVKTIKSHNYAETDDYDAAIAEGYKPCGNCKP